MALDQISQNFLAQMQTYGAIPFHMCSPEQARIIYDSGSQEIEDQSLIKKVSTRKIPVSGGKIDIFIIEPFENPQSVIVFYHGGGWVVGRAEGYLSYAAYLAKITSSTVVVVDYRKAPENPFPIPANDAYEALEWVNSNMEEIIGKRIPLVVCGESAGGNLAAVTALRAKRLDGPQIACQILACPVTADDFDNESYNLYSDQLIISKKDMIWFWNHYVPDITQRKDPLVSPLYAEDLSGLPYTVIITAEHDPLRSEGEQYAEKLIKAGVSVKVKRFEGQMHGFFTWVDFSPVSRQAQEIIANTLSNEVLTINKSQN